MHCLNVVFNLTSVSMRSRHDHSHQTSLQIYRIIYLDTWRIIVLLYDTQKNGGWQNNCEMDAYNNFYSIAVQANSFQDNMAD